MSDEGQRSDPTQPTLIEALTTACQGAGAAAGRSLFALGAEGPLVVVDAVGDDLALADRGGIVAQVGPAGTAFETSRVQRAEGLVPRTPGVPTGLVAGADHVAGVWVPLVAPDGRGIGVLELWYPAGGDDVPGDVLERAAVAFAESVSHIVTMDVGSLVSLARIAEVASRSLLALDVGIEALSHLVRVARQTLDADGAVIVSVSDGAVTLLAGSGSVPDRDPGLPARRAPGLASALREQRIDVISPGGVGRRPAPDVVASLVELGANAAVLVPIEGDDRRGTALVGWWSAARSAPTVSQLAALRYLAAAAALAVEHQREAAQVARRSDERNVLREAFAPSRIPSVEGVELAAHLEAAVDGFAGDFFDVIAHRGSGCSLIIGDALGRGPSAASLAVGVRHTLRATLSAGLSPSQSMRLANELVLDHPGGLFCTAVICTVDVRPTTALVRVTRAGHPFPLVRRGSGRVELAAPGRGQLLGVFERPGFAQDLVVLDPGDALVLYTDGVTERMVDQGRLELDGLLAAMTGLTPETTAGAICDAIFRALRLADETPPSDDTAVLVARLATRS